jgi:hypothetical protein
MVPWYCQPRGIGTAVADNGFSREKRGPSVRFLSASDLYECTNQMVLSTKTPSRPNAGRCCRLAFDPMAA